MKWFVSASQAFVVIEKVSPFDAAGADRVAIASEAAFHGDVAGNACAVSIGVVEVVDAAEAEYFAAAGEALRQGVIAKQASLVLQVVCI